MAATDSRNASSSSSTVTSPKLMLEPTYVGLAERRATAFAILVAHSMLDGTLTSVVLSGEEGSMRLNIGEINALKSRKQGKRVLEKTKTNGLTR